MTTQSPRYDTVGDLYRQYKTTATAPVLERRLFLDLLGDPTGLRVLDLATGYGLYARLAAELGAAEVVGTDVSGEMVRHAREATTSPGITFHTVDALDLGRASGPDLGTFDLVTAVWLFNYAASPDEVAAMAAGVRRVLRPGGRLVAITLNPGYDVAGPDWTPYGLAPRASVRAGRGNRLDVALLTSTTDIPLSVHQWDADVYAEALTRSGLAAPAWRLPTAPEEDGVEREPGYWAAATTNPVFAGFTTHRADR
ncbi:class I SAM-dependent methyltransferase [Saccharothrix obliqua]|uniref:class I SAM-dependent methyltransferase n=1 Tax=Saccharothrix obliqua TaxID=2861747 RepID=UPI001C5D0E63|nr:class I SAM-dependent methyltransferase [Saccharothrix obliqua]MBW4718761.1 class I SAM-dependent methyltransferase [Saccharothrix obliqua]